MWIGDVLGRHSARPRRRGWLVCPEVGVDPINYPSNIRECMDPDCGEPPAQVWVSVGTSTALVDSGELWPRCPACWLESGQPLTLHPATLEELRSRRVLEAAWRRVGELNGSRAQLEGDET